MMEDGLGFQPVPWRPAPDPQLGKHISGTMAPGGGVDWSFGKQRGLGIEHDANNPSRATLDAIAGHERASMTPVLTDINTPSDETDTHPRVRKGPTGHEATA